MLGFHIANLESAFRAHAAQLRDASEAGTSIAIDGKVLRGSFNGFEDCKAEQIVSPLATKSSVVLGQVIIHDGDKDHELAAAQRLIEELGLTGQLFTLDALHAKKMVETILASGNHLLVQMKGNQSKLQAHASQLAPLVHNRVEPRHRAA